MVSSSLTIFFVLNLNLPQHEISAELLRAILTLYCISRAILVLVKCRTFLILNNARKFLVLSSIRRGIQCVTWEFKLTMHWRFPNKPKYKQWIRG